MDEHSVLDTEGLTASEYGAGNELETTGFVIFGLLSFWMYTVWKYHHGEKID
jgi:hypothetical protein